MAQFLTAVVTVFDQEGNLHLEGNRAVYEYLINGNSDGIVALGSTGEFFGLTMDQCRQVIDLIVETVKGRMKVIIGTSRMIAKESIELSNYALSKGADAVMLVSPYYFKLDDANIEEYYDKTVPNINGNVYLYNFPTCTGYDLKPDILLNLCRKYHNIIGYKDTVPDMGHTRKVINTILPEFPSFEVYSGFDEFFIHNVMSGGAGCVGGLPNLKPEIFSEWVKAYNEKNFDKIVEIQKYVNKMMGLFDICSPFVTAIKRAMLVKGIISYEESLTPLVKASPEEDEKIRVLLKELDIK